MKNTYQNPIAAKGDFADPFVIRYNGRYYLYGTNPDIRCWSSSNMLDWKLEGPTISGDTFPNLVPFAPEVIYSNGKFYMYTSPSGFGHYVLESDHPTGPFHKISGNVEHAIDGSVFIDDDGTWYFYWAGDEGIWGCDMKSPTEFGEPVLTGATMYGWTEGPFIYKQNGYYYMTYTGNHYLSKGYRINCAWSTHPLKGYQDEAYNPVIIHTEGEVVGLGHSSTVLGPDLVSNYIVYHNMNEDLSRDLDIDRQLWYEHTTQILGPTRFPQLAPALPDYAYPEGGKEEMTWQFYKGSLEEKKDICYSSSAGLFAMSYQKFEASFTAEFNVIVPTDDGMVRGGIILGEDEANYYSIAFEKSTHNLQLWHCEEKDNTCLIKVKLPADYVFDALHCIKVEYNNQGELLVYIDNHIKIKEDNIHFGNVSLGYFSDNGAIGVGYTAITCSTYEEALQEVVIPVDCSFYPIFGLGDVVKEKDGSILLKEGKEVQYQLIADCSKDYTLYITYRINSDSSVADILIDDVKVGALTGEQGVLSYPVQLSEGIHTMKICASSEDMVISRIYVKSSHMDNKREEISLPIIMGPYGKKLLTGYCRDNYTVSALISSQFIGEDGNAGILVRVTELSEGGEGADSVLGINFFIGYSISFTGCELVITRHRYDRKVLASCPFEYELNKTYDLTVTVEGVKILVYVNQEETPFLSVIDNEPIAYGCVGLWAKDSTFSVENICIK